VVGDIGCWPMSPMSPTTMSLKYYPR